MAIVGMRRSGRKPADYWVKNLGHEDPIIRHWAAHAVREYREESDVEIPALKASMKNEDPGVRRTTAETLGAIGAEAAEALPALIGARPDLLLRLQWARTTNASPDAAVLRRLRWSHWWRRSE